MKTLQFVLILFNHINLISLSVMFLQIYERCILVFKEFGKYPIRKFWFANKSQTSFRSSKQILQNHLIYDILSDLKLVPKYAFLQAHSNLKNWLASSRGFYDREIGFQKLCKTNIAVASAKQFDN